MKNLQNKQFLSKTELEAISGGSGTSESVKSIFERIENFISSFTIGSYPWYLIKRYVLGIDPEKEEKTSNLKTVRK